MEVLLKAMLLPTFWHDFDGRLCIYLSSRGKYESCFEGPKNSTGSSHHLVCKLEAKVQKDPSAPTPKGEWSTRQLSYPFCTKVSKGNWTFEFSRQMSHIQHLFWLMWCAVMWKVLRLESSQRSKHTETAKRCSVIMHAFGPFKTRSEQTTIE
eukprot:3033128-Amphidinium_carterae.1